jgi:hypothetical protein
MKKYMEENLSTSKGLMAKPKKAETVFSMAKPGKNILADKNKTTEDVFEKYMSPVFIKKGNAIPSDQQSLHKKLRAILSRKNIPKPPSQQISQVNS